MSTSTSGRTGASASPSASGDASNSLRDAVVLITGASSGIGEASAHALARRGAKLALCARRSDRTTALAAELGERYEVDALAVDMDVTQERSVQAALEKVTARFGSLHHAFNNAGVGATHKSIDQISEAEYDVVMNTCLKGAFLCMKHELPLIAKSGGGSIVNTASVGGLVGVGGSSDYVAAKHGLIGMTKSAAIEFAPQGVRVNLIAPGPVMTDMFKRWLPTEQDQKRVSDYTLLKRIASPQEIADYVVFLMEGARYSTGVVFTCDGGLSVG